MKQTQDAKGKTVKDIFVHDIGGGYILLLFTDDTYLLLEATPDRYDTSGVDISQVDFPMDDFPRDDAIRLGIKTREEYDEWDRERNRKWQESKERREREQLATLKAKYET